MREPVVAPVIYKGLVDYPWAWDEQRRLVAARKAGEIGDTIVLLEHPHTYTVGRAGTHDHILLDDEGLRRHGVTVYDVDRGGDVTYHGRGQLVGYPIFDLAPWGGDNIHYLRRIEDALIGALAEFGIEAGRQEKYTGVWVGDEKIGAIGVKVSGGITSHGFALNVSTDLSYFSHIIPCGIRDKGVASIASLTGQAPAMEDVIAAVLRQVSRAFGVRMLPDAVLDAEALASGGSRRT